MFDLLPDSRQIGRQSRSVIQHYGEKSIQPASYTDSNYGGSKGQFLEPPCQFGRRILECNHKRDSDVDRLSSKGKKSELKSDIFEICI